MLGSNLCLGNQYPVLNLIKVVSRPDEGKRRNESNNARHLYWYIHFSVIFATLLMFGCSLYGVASVGKSSLYCLISFIL